MMHFIKKGSPVEAAPLEQIELVLEPPTGSELSVLDGSGREYFRASAQQQMSFLTGGSLGEHQVCLMSSAGQVLFKICFSLKASTRVRDGNGPFQELFEILHKTMHRYGSTGTGSVHWRGKTYRWFVPWILDHVHTAKGMRYFSDATRELVDLLALAQREDGMIWSQVSNDHEPGFFDTRDGNRNFYTRRDDEIRFMRQPAENHCEYNFVDCIHLCWKTHGDDEWMKSLLPHACHALDYTRNSPARWSQKFGLLKRGYTIDSWDFQVEDEYSVNFPVGAEMCIDEQRTKFGIFFGDNTGYATACDQLREMLAHAGQDEVAEKYHRRGREIRERLTALSWNGRFYQHRVEEDSNVQRHLGVDEKSQIAMSNAYSLNRGIPHQQARAILETYQELLRSSPEGSPGEWYAIYPPFERGFGNATGKWQYMNGGVHGHAAGEMARGAFAHGKESYGVDILLRLKKLALATGGIVRFAYTGAYDPAPLPTFTPIDLTGAATMDLRSRGTSAVPDWMKESRQGNDMNNLPTGRQVLAGVPYLITNPAENEGKAVVSVSTQAGLAESATIPILLKGTALYLLHTASTRGSSGVGATCTLVYEDGSQHVEYLFKDRHFSGWWFPRLEQKNAGIAWKGPNAVCTSVGLSWACLENPFPEKVIRVIQFHASRDGAIYAVAGITLSDCLPFHRADPVSTGGPDNWAGGLCMAALIEGLAGVEDKTVALRHVRLSPRWSAASTPEVETTVCYPASQSYLSYRYLHDSPNRTIQLTLTGSGQEAEIRVLLPPTIRGVLRAVVNGSPIPVEIEQVDNSFYVQSSVDLTRGPVVVHLTY